MSSTKLLRQYIREMISPIISHSLEPAINSIVLNTNAGCKHYGSAGKVLSVDNLESNVGKTVTYLVINNGTNFSIGDVLTKTLDQLKEVQ